MYVEYKNDYPILLHAVLVLGPLSVRRGSPEPRFRNFSVLFFFVFLNHHSQFSAYLTRTYCCRRFHPQQPPGQAVATGVLPAPPPRYVHAFAARTDAK